MTPIKAGTEVEVTITHLEMTARPSYPRPPMPLGPATALLLAENPPPWVFLDLYDVVGEKYEWVDMHAVPEAELAARLAAPQTHFYTLIRAGWPHGFFMLEQPSPEVVDLAYFGLVPEAVGQALGKFLLHTAIHTGWDLAGVERMTLNTCTLDHPRALGLYQKAGFEPVRQETITRTLTRDWNPDTF
jgi:GNAT superfamily N-acetyltransferase